jgi:hypothetical protein
MDGKANKYKKYHSSNNTFLSAAAVESNDVHPRY